MSSGTALNALSAEPRTKPSNYPSPFKEKMEGRIKRPLGDLFGLTNFGVNLTTLLPGTISALHHRHSRQDEFIYVVSGSPTLVTDEGEVLLAPGMVAGFKAGGIAHHLANRTTEEVVVLEVGDRSEGDHVTYPWDDIQASLEGSRGWVFKHKDGTPY